MTTVVIHIMARTTQLSKEKRQLVITLRHEGKLKISRTLNVSSSCKNAMMKLALMRTASGKENQELHLLHRVSSLDSTSD